MYHKFIKPLHAQKIIFFSIKKILVYILLELRDKKVSGLIIIKWFYKILIIFFSRICLVTKRDVTFHMHMLQAVARRGGGEDSEKMG